MKITKRNLDNLTSEITLVLDAADYKPDFDKELKTYKDKAHLKGFRKGKTPISALKKMYGKPLLADIVNKKISKEFDTYLKDENIDILGQPVPVDERSNVDLDINDFGSLQFVFKVGLAPEFQLVGVSQDEIYDHFEVKINDDLVDEEFLNIRKRHGSEEDIDKIVEENDRISLKVNELDEENILIEDGIEAEFTILVDRMPDEYKEKFVGKEKGTETVINILNIEKNADRAFVAKYLLKVDEKTPFDELFVARVESIKNLVPAEINQEFFDAAFGEGEVETEEQAKEIIRRELIMYYEVQGKALSERYILEELVEENDIDLPDEFLKEWLLKSENHLDEGNLDGEYDALAKNIKWSLIKSKVAETYSVEVGEDELRKSMTEKVKKMMQNYNYYDVDYKEMAESVLREDPEKARKEFEEVYARKVFDVIMENVTLKRTKIDIDEYKNRVNELGEKNK